jgi:hypothetical protein
MNLFSFLYNTMQVRVNDPKNTRYWLPTVLQGIDGSNSKGKLLPIETTNFDIGPVKGEAGTTVTTAFTGQWESYLEKVQRVDLSTQKAIPSPNTPFASLSFLNATISGLENLYVLGNPNVASDNTGYRTTITLQSNYYDGTNNKPSVPKLSIAGNYKIMQSLCTADKATPTVCNGKNSTDIDGKGFASIEIDNAFIEADLFIYVSGTGAGRTVGIKITAIRLRGANKGSFPDLQVLDIKIDVSVSSFLKGVWVTMSKKAITSPEGRTGIFSQINQQLNTADNLSKLSDTVTTQFQKALSSIMGSIPQNSLPLDVNQNVPNPADLYIFDRIRFSLNDPSGQWYLPKIVTNVNNPTLEPLKIASISIPDQPLSDFNITLSKIQLNNVVVSGLSNILAPVNQLVFQPNADLNATVNLSALPTPPPPLTATSSFSFFPTGADQTFTGSLVIRVKQSQLSFSTSLGGNDVSSLVMNLSSAKITARLADISIVLSLDSFFTDMINNSVLNQDSLKQTILDKLNQEITNNLQAIGQQITDSARKGIGGRLDS